MPGELRSHSEGQTLILTLHNPQQRNALSPEMYIAGVEALNGAESNRDVRAVVITGSEGHFCSGGSLQRLRDNRLREPAAQLESVEALHSWIETIRAFPKPVIAAVEGAAAGAGMALALACDLIVASRTAIFAASYSQVGLSPDGGLSWHLGRTLPRQLASEWLMRGERLEANRLYQAGVVNELCDSGRALSHALQWAQNLSMRAPNALASIKELLAEAPHTTLDTQLSMERDHFVRNLHHPNAGQAIEAFLARSKSSRDGDRLGEFGIAQQPGPSCDKP